MAGTKCLKLADILQGNQTEAALETMIDVEFTAGVVAILLAATLSY